MFCSSLGAAMDHLKAHFGACEIYMSSCHYTRWLKCNCNYHTAHSIASVVEKSESHALFANMRIFEGAKGGVAFDNKNGLF